MWDLNIQSKLAIKGQLRIVFRGVGGKGRMYTMLMVVMLGLSVWETIINITVGNGLIVQQAK